MKTPWILKNLKIAIRNNKDWFSLDCLLVQVGTIEPGTEKGFQHGGKICGWVCVRDMALGIPKGLAKSQQLQLKSLGKLYVAPVKVHLPEPPCYLAYIQSFFLSPPTPLTFSLAFSISLSLLFLFRH